MDRNATVHYNPGLLENLFESVISGPKYSHCSSLRVDIDVGRRAVPMESFAEIVDSLDVITRKPSLSPLASSKMYYTDEVMHTLQSNKYGEKSPQDQRITLHIILHHILSMHEADACNYIEALDSILKTSMVYDVTEQVIVTLFNPCKIVHDSSKNTTTIPLQNSIIKILLLSGNIQLAIELLKVYNREEDILLLRKRYYYSTINYSIRNCLPLY